MNCNNGQTYVNTCIPGVSDNSFVFDLTHYTCGNRKICANGFFPSTANLQYQVIGTPKNVGNDNYIVDVLITGIVTYMPYRQGQNNCGCCPPPCPVSENIWCTVSVPWNSADAPLVNAGIALCSPTNLKDCCQITNALSIGSSFQLMPNEKTSTTPSGSGD